jgi:hypothetical protein
VTKKLGGDSYSLIPPIKEKNSLPPHIFQIDTFDEVEYSPATPHMCNNYNKTKSCGESTVTFLAKHCGLLQCLPTWFFFLMIFLKLSLLILFCLILSWLRITITRLNYVGKHYSSPRKTLWIATMFTTWFFCVFLL